MEKRKQYRQLKITFRKKRILGLPILMMKPATTKARFPLYQCSSSWHIRIMHSRIYFLNIFINFQKFAVFSRFLFLLSLEKLSILNG